jgi:hypothetical protein
LQRVAIGIVTISGCVTRAGEDTAHRADLVGAVVIGLRRRAGNVLALGIILARHRVAGIARLADARAAPDVRCGDRAPAAGGRRGNRGAAAETVVAERGRLAGLPRIGDADEPVLGVPGVIAQPVRGDIAVGVEGQRSLPLRLTS